MNPECRASFGSADPMLAARLARARQTNRDSGKDLLVQDAASLRKSLQYGTNYSPAGRRSFSEISSPARRASHMLEHSGLSSPRSTAQFEHVASFNAGSERPMAEREPMSSLPHLPDQQAVRWPMTPRELSFSNGPSSPLRSASASATFARVGTPTRAGSQLVATPSKFDPNEATSADATVHGAGLAPAEASVLSVDDRNPHADPVGQLFRPATNGQTVECIVRRDRKGLGRLWPTFRMYMQREDGDEFLLAARRRKKQTDGQAYLITRSPDDFEKGPNYVAKLRSNFLGTEWMLYDSGSNPKKMKSSTQGDIRKELAFISCEQNVFGDAGPRRVHLTSPGLDDDGTPRVRQPTTEAERLPAIVKAARANADEFISMHTKEAPVDPVSGKHALNFNGRVTRGSDGLKWIAEQCIGHIVLQQRSSCASLAGCLEAEVKAFKVKNMQLVKNDHTDAILFQFGKVDKNDFTLDYTWPLTPLQAFGVAISTLAYKLANEGG